MSDRTGIEWTDATWNPVTGCTKVSPGCDHCYAETLAERFRGTPGHYYERGFDVQLRPEKLDQPLRWRRPRRIFVNSMSDLFHDDVPDDYIARVFAVMALAPQHTFQVLTKRHGRMRSLLTTARFYGQVRRALRDEHGLTGLDAFGTERFPLPNVWLGVSVENQQWADIRIPALLDTPAAVRFLSCEPLLGPVNLIDWLPERSDWCDLYGHEFTDPDDVSCVRCGYDRDRTYGIGWVIVGGESGRGARPMHPDWARSLRDQCVDAGVPFLFKQWGEWAPGHRNIRLSKRRWQYESTRFAPDGTDYRADQPDLYSYPGMESLLRVGKKAAGRELDGRTWDEYPEAVTA